MEGCGSVGASASHRARIRTSPIIVPAADPARTAGAGFDGGGFVVAGGAGVKKG